MNRREAGSVPSLAGPLLSGLGNPIVSDAVQHSEPDPTRPAAPVSPAGISG